MLSMPEDDSSTWDFRWGMNKNGSGVPFVRVPWASEEMYFLATTKHAGCVRRSDWGLNHICDGNGTFHGTFLLFP